MSNAIPVRVRVTVTIELFDYAGGPAGNASAVASGSFGGNPRFYLEQIDPLLTDASRRATGAIIDGVTA